MSQSPSSGLHVRARVRPRRRRPRRVASPCPRSSLPRFASGPGPRSRRCRRRRPRCAGHQHPAVEPPGRAPARFAGPTWPGGRSARQAPSSRELTAPTSQPAKRGCRYGRSTAQAAGAAHLAARHREQRPRPQPRWGKRRRTAQTVRARVRRATRAAGRAATPHRESRPTLARPAPPHRPPAAFQNARLERPAPDPEPQAVGPGGEQQRRDVRPARGLDGQGCD
jgi:hypothetical protein